MAVLKVLHDDSRIDGEMCIGFSWIMGATILSMGRKEVRDACRSLRNKGLAQFVRGLMTEDGQVAGAGYCITMDGCAFLQPCDVCGKMIDYDYTNEKNGQSILECSNHYQKSPKHLL